MTTPSPAAVLRAWREEHRRASSRPHLWTQKAVARRLGVSVRTYIRWEQGEVPVPSHIIRRIPLHIPITDEPQP